MATIDQTMSVGNEHATEFGAGQYDLASFNNHVARHGTPTNAGYRCFGCRFLSLSISKSSTIDVAYMEIWPDGTSNDDMYCQIHCEATASPNDFNVEQVVIGRPRSTAFTVWQEASIGAAAYIKSPSLIGPIQEMVNIGAITNLVILWIADIQNPNDQTRFNGVPASNPPKLHLEYTEAVVSSSIRATGTMQRRPMTMRKGLYLP